MKGFKFITIVAFVLVSFIGNSQCIEGDCFNGYGTFKCSCGYIYVGEFKEGQKVNGTLTKEDLVYTGNFKDDVAEGEGIIKFIDSTWYEGSFINNFPEGYGTFHFADGTTYTGEMFEGNFKGLGLKQYPANKEGLIVFKIGQFAADLLNGFGFVSDSSQIVFGAFVNGLPQGFCMMIGQDSLPVMGKYKKGKIVQEAEQIELPMVGYFSKPLKIGKEWYKGELKGGFLSITVTNTEQQKMLIVYDAELKQFYISNLGEPELGKVINTEGEIYPAKFNFALSKIEILN